MTISVETEVDIEVDEALVVQYLKECTSKEAEELIERAGLKRAGDSVGIKMDELTGKLKSVEDQMKMQHFINVMDRYSIGQLTNLLSEGN